MKANALTVSLDYKSTNVRLTPRPRASVSRKPSDLARNALQILSLVAPHLAAVWVAKRFLTPPPARPLSPKSQAFLGSADDRFTVRLDMNLRGTRDTSRVQVSLWGRGPAVYMLHGWGGRGTRSWVHRGAPRRPRAWRVARAAYFNRSLRGGPRDRRGERRACAVHDGSFARRSCGRPGNETGTAL